MDEDRGTDLDLEVGVSHLGCRCQDPPLGTDRKDRDRTGRVGTGRSGRRRVWVYRDEDTETP